MFEKIEIFDKDTPNFRKDFTNRLLRQIRSNIRKQ